MCREIYMGMQICFRIYAVVHSLSHARLFVTPWTAAHQASLSFTLSWSLLRFTFIESGFMSAL